MRTTAKCSKSEGAIRVHATITVLHKVSIRVRSISVAVQCVMNLDGAPLLVSLLTFTHRQRVVKVRGMRSEH